MSEQQGNKRPFPSADEEEKLPVLIDIEDDEDEEDEDYDEEEESDDETKENMARSVKLMDDWINSRLPHKEEDEAEDDDDEDEDEEEELDLTPEYELIIRPAKEMNDPVNQIIFYFHDFGTASRCMMQILDRHVKSVACTVRKLCPELNNMTNKESVEREIGWLDPRKTANAVASRVGDHLTKVSMEKIDRAFETKKQRKE